MTRGCPKDQIRPGLLPGGSFFFLGATVKDFLGAAVRIAIRMLRTLHAPASRRAEKNERVTTYAQNFDDAPHDSVTVRGKQ